MDVHLACTTSRAGLAIQVFKGHYKSDKPDGVIPSGEAEVRHYAMETSISGGIVATICFSLSTRSPLGGEDVEGGGGGGGAGSANSVFFFCRKTNGKSRVRMLPRLMRAGPARRNLRIVGCTRRRAARSTSAKPSARSKAR